MNRNHFSLTDEQFVKLRPHLPTDTRGKPRVEDRRVISGIIHVIKSGGRWVDAPAVYGPRKHSTTAPSAGRPKACGVPYSTPWPMRKWKNCFSPYLYRDLSAIERVFCRLKDFRHIATRYERLATNFLAAICIAATVSYW